MNPAALAFAIIGAAITFVGFGFAGKLESKFMSALAKIGALVIGFLSMPALESVMNVKGSSAAGGYWFYILLGAWLLSRLLGGSDNVGK
jgi:formyltetrahydrofolate synthetase